MDWALLGLATVINLCSFGLLAYSRRIRRETRSMESDAVKERLVQELKAMLPSELRKMAADAPYAGAIITVGPDPDGAPGSVNSHVLCDPSAMEPHELAEALRDISLKLDGQLS
ncbi:hypothetical protein Y710_16595 [Gordonia sp. QH-12]|uniref:hypothetical protein n=1 Tax=Gordonia sp. QH-12 TaxID=1437876 RepID=UPI000785DD39|nr:hypothetical protein [Gordonia sp. QH-12]KXT55957.1 hypothetical protein Y710_16595 [Gordonia sp. QH-12]